MQSLKDQANKATTSARLDKSIKSKSVKRPQNESTAAKREPPWSAKTNLTFNPQSPKSASSKRLTFGNALFSMRTFNAELDLPIVYSAQYNIRLMGLELAHRCDTKRYEKLAHQLNLLFAGTPQSRPRIYDEHTVSREDDIADTPQLRFLAPNRPVSLQELKLHHTSDYARQLHEDRSLLARISETWFIYLVPMCVLEQRLLAPIKLQTAGTIFATHLAMQHGWALNLGGGFHTAFADYGETFCFVSDVLLAMKYVWRRHPLQKFMIIDLDAHQATGIERDLVDLPLKRRQSVFMLDSFNRTIQPTDAKADRGIDLRIELPRFCGDDIYLKLLDDALTSALSAFKPSLVFYIAGQDILLHDQLGLMNVTDGGLIKRDELVFSHVSQRNRCPIVMLLGGGYTARGVRVQANSIKNLYDKNLIWAGHRSGSRTLTRPRPGRPDNRPESSVSKTRAAATATAGCEPTTGFLKTIKSRDAPTTSIAPEVNAISESMSTSSGARRTQVVRLVKIGEKSIKSTSRKGILRTAKSVLGQSLGAAALPATPPTALKSQRQTSKSTKRPQPDLGKAT